MDRRAAVIQSLADLVARRPGRIALVAAVLAAVAVAFSGRVAESLKPFGFEDPDAESAVARRTLADASGIDPENTLVALVRPGAEVRTAPARAEVERVAAVVARDQAVARVVTAYDGGGPALVSRDGRSTYLVAFFEPVSDEAREDAIDRIEEALAGARSVTLGGGAAGFKQVGETVEEDLVRAELIAFPILFLLAFWVFRGVVAALLPVLVGGLTILLTFLALRVAAEVTDLSIFALNLVTGMGLGLGIDWSLLVVSRYREELAGAAPAEAVRRTLATAGRTVLFSALTVAAALAAMLVFPQRFLYSMGIGGVLAALIGGTVALVVLPAVLALLGDRVNALAPRRWQRAAEPTRPAAAGGWYRLSRFVMRRPARIAAASAALLVSFGLPFLRVEFTAADARVLPEEASARRVFETLSAEFALSRLTPVYLAVPAATRDEVDALTERLRALPGAAAVDPPQALGQQAWRIDVISRTDYLSEQSQRLVRELRALPAPVELLVGGDTAVFVDQKASLKAHLPLALALVAVATLLVLFLMTGSAVLPLKSLVMNLLTVSATFGFLVLVFQDGRLESVLRYSSQGALELSEPILLFAIVFALSTDYGVFLLTRIIEARDAGAPGAEAVAVGLERTGRIVSAAALLFCVAMGAFATSRIVFIKEVGLGIAFAVLVDATIVRALLVPALMRLLGRWNWWAPAPLRRLHERLGLSEA